MKNLNSPPVEVELLEVLTENSLIAEEISNAIPVSEPISVHMDSTSAVHGLNNAYGLKVLNGVDTTSDYSSTISVTSGVFTISPSTANGFKLFSNGNSRIFLTPQSLTLTPKTSGF